MKKIEINKKDLGFNPQKIKNIEKVDIFEDRIEISFDLEDG